jgi:phage antirepressor YoqD-like protein
MTLDTILSDLIVVLDRTKAQLEAMQRLTQAQGAVSLREAAKMLKVAPGELIDRLSRERWIYRTTGSRAAWQGFQTKVDQGLLTHRAVRRHQPDGPDKLFNQVLVTAKGVAKLAAEISDPAGTGAADGQTLAAG